MPRRPSVRRTAMVSRDGRQFLAARRCMALPDHPVRQGQIHPGPRRSHVVRSRRHRDRRQAQALGGGCPAYGTLSAGSSYRRRTAYALGDVHRTFPGARDRPGGQRIRNAEGDQGGALARGITDDRLVREHARHGTAGRSGRLASYFRHAVGARLPRAWAWSLCVGRRPGRGAAARRGVSSSCWPAPGRERQAAP